MAELLVRFTESLVGEDGTRYLPQVKGGLAADGLWEGWIEFKPQSGPAMRTDRETEQPNRDALIYWAEGLTAVYLEGALARAVTRHAHPTLADGAKPNAPPLARPAQAPIERTAHAILDPFATYAEGEELLRKQLKALSHDHLVNIVKAYALPISGPHELQSESDLVDAIVGAVARADSNG